MTSESSAHGDSVDAATGRLRSADGAPLRDRQTLARIRALAIPPAWTDVWICPIPSGHIQAEGRDARGRKQYRYHSRWREIRDETKYARLIDSGRALPRIRRRVHDDLARPGLSRNKVLATVVRLIETTLIRVGNRNTPAICRTCYIHPAILEAFRESALGPPMDLVGRGRSSHIALQPGERVVLRLLERRQSSR